MLPYSPRILAATFIIFLFPLFLLEAQDEAPVEEDASPGESLDKRTFKDNFHWAIHGSIFVFAANNGKQGADPLPILPSFGASVAWQFWGPLRLEITEDLYFTNYEYNYEPGYPMACNPENRSAFVMGFLTGIHFAGAFSIGEKGYKIRVYGGPAFDLRIVALAAGLNHPGDFTGDENDPKVQTDAISKYFWGKGRWFLPVFGIGIDFPISEKFLLGFDFRTWFPVYRLWTHEEIPAIDGWRFGVGLRITPRKVLK